MRAVSLASLPEFEPDPTVFLATVVGFENRMLASRQKPSSATKAGLRIKFFARKLGSPIWTAQAMDAFMADCHRAGYALGTQRYDQLIVKDYVDFVRDPANGYSELFREAYGSLPIQPYLNRQTIPHVSEVESQRDVRAIRWDELHAFFAHADYLADTATDHSARRAMLRESAMFKFGAALGLRCMEMADCRISQWAMGRCTLLSRSDKPVWSMRVLGKSMPYGPPKPRTVFVSPHFPWAVDVYDDYMRNVRPLFSRGDGDHVFVTEAGRPLHPGYISARFAMIRDSAGLSKDISTHAMRRQWATRLAVNGVPLFFIQDQLGHESPATTLGYIKVPDRYIQLTARLIATQSLHP